MGWGRGSRIQSDLFGHNVSFFWRNVFTYFTSALCQLYSLRLKSMQERGQAGSDLRQCPWLETQSSKCLGLCQVSLSIKVPRFTTLVRIKYIIEAVIALIIY